MSNITDEKNIYLLMKVNIDCDKSCCHNVFLYDTTVENSTSFLWSSFQISNPIVIKNQSNFNWVTFYQTVDQHYSTAIVIN